jgi:probable F420-dependent oxidoreductase
MTTPFRFGVSVRRATSRSDWREKARRAEALGFSTFLVPDHLATILPPFVALASAAEATETLRVGTLVINNDFRHPALVARDASALDLLSDGRFELGMGSGHMQSEYAEIGLPFDNAPVRAERLQEAVTIIKRLLERETLDFDGRYYQIQGHEIPPPVQRPRPPLLLGGNSDHVLRVAAKEADIVSFIGFSHRRGGREFDLTAFSEEGTADRVEFVRREAGTRFASLELSALVQRVEITRSVEETVAQIAREHEVSEDSVLDSPYLLVGSLEGIVETLQRRRELLGLSYIVVFEGAMEASAPIISELAGH